MPALPIELRTALMLHEEGQPAAAEGQCRQLLEREPQHAEGRYLLASLLLEQGRAQEAVPELQQALALAPHNGDFWLKLTEALLELGQAHQALETIEGAIAQGLDWPQAVALREQATAALEQAAASQDQAQSPIPEHWTLTLVDDLRICVPSSLECMTTYALLEQEDWFEPERAFLARLVEPGMNILDVGARYGVYALTLAKWLKGRGQVLAIEPDHAAANLLEKSIADNDLGEIISLRRITLCAQSGERHNPLTDDPVCTGTHDSVTVSTLDMLIKDPLWQPDARIDLIRLDLSGDEAQALQGAQELLDQHDPIIFMNAQQAQTPDAPLRQQLSAQGYQCYRLLPGLDALLPLESHRLLDICDAKIFFCKPSRANRLEHSGYLYRQSVSCHEASPASCHWSQTLANLPYVKAIEADGQGMAAWKNIESSADPHWPDYELALNSYLSAIDFSQPLNKRADWLTLSLTTLEQLHHGGDEHIATHLLRIRALCAAGAPAQACQVAQTLLNIFENSQSFLLERPFLPPLVDYDQRAPIDHFTSWLDAGIRESIERLGSLSTCVDTQDLSANTQLGELVNNPNVSPVIQRRFALQNLPKEHFSLRPLSITLTEVSSDEISGKNLKASTVVTKSLDLGSGLTPRNPFNAEKVVGIDLGAENLVAVQRPSTADYEVLQHDLILEPLPFGDQEFDYVTAFDFLEHVPRLIYTPKRRTPFIDLMNEIYRVLKPEGVLLSVTPAFPQPAAFQDPTHVNIITEDTFRFYFDHVNRWARIYGFTGAFRIMSQEWQGQHLVTHMIKHEHTDN
jgi:FkbM family methyltransferase